MWPWDWVIAGGNAIAGLSQKVVDWVNSVIASVMSWVTDAINAIWRTINSIWSRIQEVWDEAVKVIETMASGLYTGLSYLSRTLYAYIDSMVSGVWDYARRVYDWVVRIIDDVRNYLLSLINAIYQWVQREIWDPLKRLYDGIMAWATQWFNKIWQYIEHPELLVQLIGAFLLRMWLQYVLRFGAVFARWLVRNMMGMAGEVFDMLERVLSSII